MLSFAFHDIISTRRYRTENNVQYVDFKCGNLMNHKITRIETDQVGENLNSLLVALFRTPLYLIYPHYSVIEFYTIDLDTVDSTCFFIA